MALSREYNRYFNTTNMEHSVKHVIFGIVAQSGAGKTTITDAITQSYPDKVAIIRSLTTRQRRDDQDDRYYEFVSRDEFERARDAGELVQAVEYAGNYYGMRRSEAARILATHNGILPIIEQGIFDLRKSGFTVVPIRIKSIGAPEFPDQRRRIADRERAQVNLDGFVVENRFEPGGLQKTVEKVTSIVSAQV
jgi:guanylate kinase